MKSIAFIGIGLMGFPMAKNLLKSGYNLKAYNRSQDKADRLKEFGAEISVSIKDVVTNSDIIITMLTDDNAVEKVMGSDEFISTVTADGPTQRDRDRESERETCGVRRAAAGRPTPALGIKPATQIATARRNRTSGGGLCVIARGTKE